MVSSEEPTAKELKQWPILSNEGKLDRLEWGVPLYVDILAELEDQIWRVGGYKTVALSGG